MNYENSEAVIDSKINYWLVRPGIGNLCYDKFKKNSVIAIGWDRIGEIVGEDNERTLNHIKDLVSNSYHDILQEQYKTQREYKRRITEIATKIFRFNFELKKDDIIVCPGDTKALIGRVVGDVFIDDTTYSSSENQMDDEYIGALNKVRAVEWIKEVDKNRLEPNIQLELRVAHGICQINREQVITEINRTVFSMFSYGGKNHSVFRVNNEEAIDFVKYAKFIKCIFEILEKYNTLNEELYIKTNINSPGPIELIGQSKLVYKISVVAKMIFKVEEIYPELSDDVSWIESKQKEYGDDDYSEYEFPSGGQI